MHASWYGLAAVVFAAAAIRLLWPMFRVLSQVKRLWRIFVSKGDSPMEARHYAAYRDTKRLAAILVEEGAASRLLLVKTAPGVQRLLVDVSSRGQFTFLLEHMRQHEPLKASEQIVLDIGANDGFQGSHSYNLVELGWWAALIEANPALEPELRQNALRPRWLGHEARVLVRMVAATDGDDGTRTLYVQGWRHSASSLREPQGGNTQSVKVKAESIQTLTAAIHDGLRDRGLEGGLPRSFGLLSLDVEGVDFELLRGFFELGYRPHYIVAEERTDVARYDQFLGVHGYERLARFDADVIYWRAERPD